jgi:O-acetyl-ADP-ribose deacetylase (regulator of RNase III)
MLAYATAKAIPCVGLPRIGSGLSGIPWHDVRAVLLELGASSQVELRIF